MFVAGSMATVLSAIRSLIEIADAASSSFRASVVIMLGPSNVVELCVVPVGPWLASELDVSNVAAGEIGGVESTEAVDGKVSLANKLVAVCSVSTGVGCASLDEWGDRTAVVMVCGSQPVGPLSVEALAAGEEGKSKTDAELVVVDASFAAVVRSTAREPCDEELSEVSVAPVAAVVVPSTNVLVVEV